MLSWVPKTEEHEVPALLKFIVCQVAEYDFVTEKNGDQKIEESTDRLILYMDPHKPKKKWIFPSCLKEIVRT